MCGIAGAFQVPAYEDVKRMVEKLSHRGPDDRGIQNFPDAALGHTRLSIIDVEGGYQPMQYEDAWIVFNGEIYNYRELYGNYLSGEKLKTHSDTEVVLRLYRLLGPECVNLLDGMFALAIYQNGEYFLARDPFGIKPLYLGSNSDNPCLYFASEIKALAGRAETIKEFPPGHSFHSKMGWKQYYQLERSIRLFDGSEADALPLIKSTLREATHKRLLADVPVGVSLSGGLDSSIVSALACEGTEQLHSFVVGVEGGEDLLAARKMSDLLNTQHHELIYAAQDMIEALPNVLYHLETFDPALVRSAIPNFFLAKLASQYVKVFLTGEGADEIYAGYDYLSRYESGDSLQKEMISITEALHNTNLQRADRMSMAFGLEARVPFLDAESVSVALGFPPEWKLHRQRVPKALLRKAFEGDLPEEIVNRPKQKFSHGAGSSDLLAQIAEAGISDSEFESESRRLKNEWDYNLQNKEALYYYKTLRGFYDDQWILPTIGQSRSL